MWTFVMTTEPPHDSLQSNSISGLIGGSIVTIKSHIAVEIPMITCDLNNQEMYIQMEKFLRTRRADVIEGFQPWQKIIFSLCFSSSVGESFAHNSSTWLILRNVCIRKHNRHFICSHWQCCYHCCRQRNHAQPEEVQEDALSHRYTQVFSPLWH